LSCKTPAAEGADGRILFTSDRPRGGEAHLYPQLDEYEEAPTNTGLWSLDPASGDLRLLDHDPSGAFTPIVDSFGRVIYTRWDHLQRGQQADTDAEEDVYGTFDYADERLYTADVRRQPMRDPSLPETSTFRAVVHEEEAGGYWAEVPDLPGCFTQGKTLDEVYHNLIEAIACHLGSDSQHVRVGLLEIAA
jgi:predicted RNase H-like HicB family nuclease